MEDVTKGADSRLSPSGSLPGLLVISTRHLRGVSSGLKSTSTAINRGAVGVFQWAECVAGCCNFAGPCTGTTALSCRHEGHGGCCWTENHERESVGAVNLGEE